MRAEFTLRVAGPPEAVMEAARRFFEEWQGYEVRELSAREALLHRGTRAGRVLSSRVERWPGELRLRLYGDGSEDLGLVAVYQVSTGMRLVGAMERAILESEMALFQEYLRCGRRQSLPQAVAPARRPVTIAVVLNVVLAMGVVVVVGLLAGYRPLHVGLAALVVGLLDGITIAAFADLLVEGVRTLPRLRAGPAPDPSSVEAAPSREG